jgi:hypothetical protein
MNTTRPTSKAIRTAARTITTSASAADRLNWLRDNSPEVAAFIEAEASRLVRPSANEYARTAMQRFSRLVNGR